MSKEEIIKKFKEFCDATWDDMIMRHEKAVSFEITSISVEYKHEMVSIFKFGLIRYYTKGKLHECGLTYDEFMELLKYTITAPANHRHIVEK